MTLEFRIEIDKLGAGHPYWVGAVKQDGNTLLEVPSQTFNAMDDEAMKARYENCTVRMMKTLMEQKDKMMIKYLLTKN